jgi:cytochrome P450
MSVVSDLELPQINHLDPSFRGATFHDTMRDLRAQGWLAQSPLGYFVLDRESVDFFLKSKKLNFPGKLVVEMFGVTDGPLHEEVTRNVLCIDGGDHRRLRNLANPSLTARAVERYRPAIRGFLADLWEKVAAQGECEFVADFAKPYPALTIATVMGAPLEDAERLYDWSNWIQKQFAADVLEQRAEIEQAIVEFYAYTRELLDRRRADPKDDLLSSLIAAEEDGDRLSGEECVNLALNVLIGGVDTTQSQLCHAMRLFAEHPDQWQLLAENPHEVAPQAVDEVMRYEPIVPFTARITLEEIEYRGVTFPPNTVVMTSAFDANRDPGSWDAPEAFDITADRGGVRSHTFGAGIHYCLGANLARLEMTEALAYLAPRMRDLRLAGEPVLGSVHGIYGIDELPLSFKPAL